MSLLPARGAAGALRTAGACLLAAAAVSGACAPRPRPEPVPTVSPDRFRDVHLAADEDGAVYVAAIEGGFGGGNRIFVVASADHGQSWRPQVALHPRSRRSRYDVEIAAEMRGGVFVVWLEEPRRIAFNRSLDGGRSWLAEEIDLDRPIGSALHPTEPQIAADDRGNLYVVWLDDREGFEAFYATASNDAGSTWSSTIRITPLSLGRKSAPQLRCDDWGNVFVLWIEEREGQLGIYFNASHDFGMTWEPHDLRLDANRGVAGFSLASRRDRGVIAAWSEFDAGQATLWARTSTDEGRSWDALRRLSSADRTLGEPSSPLAYTGDQRHSGVAWQVPASDGAERIIVAHSSDAGARFETRAIDCSNVPPIGLVPLGRSFETRRFGVAADANGNVYVTWAEVGLGPGNILCERLIAGVAPGLRSGIRASITSTEYAPLEAPRVHADDFGNVVVVWNEGARLLVATSAFFGDTGWRTIVF